MNVSITCKACGLRFQVDSRFVSRHHCQIVTTPNSCVIEDLNSTNGIYVKSKRVRRHYLNDGDVVVLGKHELIYVDERLAKTRNAMTDTVPGLHALQSPAANEGIETEGLIKTGVEPLAK